MVRCVNGDLVMEHLIQTDLSPFGRANRIPVRNGLLICRPVFQSTPTFGLAPTRNLSPVIDPPRQFSCEQGFHHR